MSDEIDAILKLLAQCDALLNTTEVWNDTTDALYEHRSELQNSLQQLIRSEPSHVD